MSQPKAPATASGKTRSPGRAGSPISLYPLTPEEALRRAMRAPVPKDEPKQPPMAKAKKAAKKKG